MITDFGKELRKIRIDRGEILKDMADKLGITASYLSAIECGKREVPWDFSKRISEIYGLGDSGLQLLQDLQDCTTKEVRILLDNRSTAERGLAIRFARKFDELSEEETKELMRIIENIKKKNKS